MAHGDASFSAQVRFQQRVTVEIILKTLIVQLIAQFIEQFELIVNLTTLNFTANVCALIRYGHDCACID